MTDYTLLRDQLLALAEDVEYEITNLSNASALLYHSLEGLNWAGFYLCLNCPVLDQIPSPSRYYHHPRKYYLRCFRRYFRRYSLPDFRRFLCLPRELPIV